MLYFNCKKERRRNMSKLSNRAIVIIGFIIIIAGLLLVSGDYLKSKKDKAYREVSVSLYVDSENGTQDNTPQNVDADTSEPEQPEPAPEQPSKDYHGYLGILTIDKLNLTQGFYDKNNSNNNVSKNITFLEPSNYPDEQNGNVILVSHSGTSRIAYFKNLYKLNVGDTAKIDYKGKIYTYKIDDIYKENKDGNVTIYRDTNRSTLTMITCTKNDNTKQTVYIAYLESVN